MMFYTSQWKGDRCAEGRPKVADDLLQHTLDVTIEDVWDYLREQGYRRALTLTSPRCAFFKSSIKVRDWPIPPPMLSASSLRMID
jgi:hypothetical protein